jgi:hypothetical protein
LAAPQTFDFALEKADKTHISLVLKLLQASDAVLCTDSGQALSAATHEIGIVPSPNQSGRRNKVVDEIYHVQNVYAYDRRVKTPTYPIKKT